MNKLRVTSEKIRQFILEKVDTYPREIAKIAAAHFCISRQALNKHIQKLVAESLLTVTGKTRNQSYQLALLSKQRFMYKDIVSLAEDLVWRKDILPILGDMPKNVLEIWHYGFTEMFNNAIDHSQGKRIVVEVEKTAINTRILLYDDGIGIFKKIQKALHLLDERHALLELSKGKLTTDPTRHSGEGIFFSSRMFDSYDIISGGVSFSNQFAQPEDWILENKLISGTAIKMVLYNQTERSLKNIFDQYTLGDDYVFNKTVVPVQLAQYGDELLVSRSQAKRLLARIEVFKTVVFDFEEVRAIGQAFADEIFRVFANQNPQMELLYIHANTAVKQMINRVIDKNNGMILPEGSQ